jgi:hypothetical protein
MRRGLPSLGAFCLAPIQSSSSDSLPSLVRSIADALSHWGVPSAIVAGLLIIVPAILALGPLKLVEIFWRVLALVFDFARRHHTRAAVEEKANAFLSALSPQLSGVSIPRVSIDWVKQTEDPRLLADGRVIVRLRREKDQTRNVLWALLYATPMATFPHARPYLSKQLSQAIDMELLRRLADQLGGHARAILDTEILGPRTVADEKLRELLPVMQTLRSRGFFESVLLGSGPL